MNNSLVFTFVSYASKRLKKLKYYMFFPRFLDPARGIDPGRGKGQRVRGSTGSNRGSTGSNRGSTEGIDPVYNLYIK